METNCRCTEIPIVNDFNRPAAIPLVKIEVNGRTLEFILDTGGDRLYIDEGVAEKVGIRNISKHQARYAPPATVSMAGE